MSSEPVLEPPKSRIAAPQIVGWVLVGLGAVLSLAAGGGLVVYHLFPRAGGSDGSVRDDTGSLHGALTHNFPTLAKGQLVVAAALFGVGVLLLARLHWRARHGAASDTRD